MEMTILADASSVIEKLHELIATVLRETYIEIFIVTIAMVLYFRLSKVCESFYWNYATNTNTVVKRKQNTTMCRVMSEGRKRSVVDTRLHVAQGATRTRLDLQQLIDRLTHDGFQNCRTALASYEDIVHCKRTNLTKCLDQEDAVFLYRRLIDLVIHESHVSAKTRISRLLGDMRAFGVPRSREFLLNILEALMAKHLYTDALWFHEALTAEKTIPDRNCYNLLVHAAAAAQADNKLELFFEELCKTGPPNMRAVMCVLRLYGRTNDWRGAAWVLNLLHKSGGAPDSLALNAAIGICISSGNVEAVENIIRDWEVQVDTVSCNQLMKGYSKRADLHRAEKLMDKMLASGPRPNVITFNTMMDCAVRTLQGRNAETKQVDVSNASVGMNKVWAILGKMKCVGLQADRYTCSTIVKGMHLVGGSKEGVDRVMELVKNINFDTTNTETNFRLVEVLFNTLLDACVDICDLDRIFKVITAMEDHCVEVSAVTYGTLIKAFSQAGHLELCHEAWLNMRKANVVPSVVTYGCYIEACVRNGDAAKAYDTFLSMASDGIEPNSVVYCSIIKGCKAHGMTKRSLELYQEMRRKCIAATSVTVNTMLDIIIHYQDDHCEDLKAVIRDLKQMGVSPNYGVYTNQVKTTAERSQLADGMFFYERLKKHGLLLDESSFNTLLLACSRAGRLEDAETLFEQMCEQGLHPTVVTLSIMVKMYGKAKMLTKAVALCKIAETTFNVKPNLYLYTCLVQACVRNRQVAKSWQIFGWIFAAGMMPDSIAYGTAIHGCVYHSKLEEAMAFVRHAHGLPEIADADAKTISQVLKFPVPPRSRPVQLQTDVLRTLIKGLRRKGYYTEAEHLRQSNGQVLNTSSDTFAPRSRTCSIGSTSATSASSREQMIHHSKDARRESFTDDLGED